ncbi:hypothetical protein CPB83DRAFT_268093 [Crepidotus variabilis]|uniref:DUF6535 domain-containing protein n=1 Tax=Crepidotus variabilis TaxID=179855 RepID=A0A9P6JQC5_9AGAR|nr:hypothetical protein CPB83DRAFT_268093 [Crepidotus variabilis]
MQADALDRFLVPQLFALLPLLLIISLVLFLIGLADFVWALNHQIAIPVLVASIFVFCFLLFTTLYTSFQALPCEVPRSRSSPTPRTPCPYKSPQSWACFKVVLVLKELFYFSMWCTTELLSRVPSLGIVDDVDTIPFEQLKHGWINQATLWLRQRDLDVLKFYADEELLPLSDDISNPDYAVVSAGLYDTVASLQTAKSELSLAKSNRLSHVFQCFQDLTSIPDQAQSLLPSVRWKHDLRIQYLLTEVLTIDGRLVTPYPRDGFTLAEKQFALDNTRLWFLLDEAFSIRVVTPHHLELLVRVLRWLVEHVDVKFVLPVSESLGLFSKPFPVKFLLINASNQTSEPLQRTLRSQFGAILTGFFDLASNHRPPVEEIGQTLLTTTYLQGLLETASFLSRDTTSFGQFKAAVMPKLISYFAQGQKREQVPEKSPDSDTTSPELEFLLVSVAIFMNELMFYPNSLTPEEKHGVFKGLSDCNKSCDQTYIRTLLGSVLYYDDRVWPMDFIDYHLSNLPALQAVQVRHSTDSASKHHISVDFSTSPGPYVPYDDLSHSQVLETSHTHTETSASPNINSQIVGPRRAWRSQPISLRHDEKHSDLNVWDASL